MRLLTAGPFDWEGVLWIVKQMLISAVWAPFVIFAHELGHAFAALALTSGPVSMAVERPRTGQMTARGLCVYDPSTLRSARHEAAIALAGPLVSLAGTILFFELTVRYAFENTFGTIFMSGLVTSGIVLFNSAVPMTYGAGLGGGESDGRVAWRILTGSPPGRDRVWDDSAPAPADRVAGPAYLVVLALVTVLSFIISLPLGLFVVALFLWAWRSQTRDAGA